MYDYIIYYTIYPYYAQQQHNNISRRRLCSRGWQPCVLKLASSTIPKDTTSHHTSTAQQPKNEEEEGITCCQG